jgi:ankyrin repeat protein
MVGRPWLRDYFDHPDEALYACVRDNDLEKLQQLLRNLPPPDVNYFPPGLGVGPPVHFAAECGSLEAVELLLNAGADPLLVGGGDELSTTALGFAASKGHRDIVKRLWKICPPEEHVNGVHPVRTPLVLAAIYGHAVVAEDLLDWWNGWSQDLKSLALLWAARRWHSGVVSLLLDKAVFEVSTLQEALHAAAQLYFNLGDDLKLELKGINYVNQQFLVTSLIDAGADPNSCQNNQPLIFTIAYNANLTGVLKILLERGADPNKTNMAGKSALCVVAECVTTATARLFVKPDCQNETAIRLLLQHKGSVSQPDNRGECPIHRAAYGLDLRLFRLYLNSGSDRDRAVLLRLTNHSGETLLHFAAAGCRIDTMEFLIAQGLDVNAKNSNGWTPILCALTPIAWNSYSSKSPTEAMQAAHYLLSQGTDASITTDEGWTPLHALALHCNADASGKAADLAQDLISRGANPEARAPLLSPNATTWDLPFSFPWGYRLREAMADPSPPNIIIRPALTPLFWAAERGAVGVIKTLIAHGVDVSLTDVEGPSPTRMVAESKMLKNQPEIIDNLIELLLAAGAGF